MIQKMNLQNNLNIDIDDLDVTIMLLYYYGDRTVSSKITDLTDEEIANLIVNNNLNNWVDMVNSLDLPLGVTSKEVITLTESITDSGTNNTNKTDSESALNADEFIAVESTNVTQDITGNKDKTREQETIKTNDNKRQRDIIEKTNNVCYNIVKNIANDIALKIY